MSDLRPKIYAFGPFRIDLDERQLFRAGEPIPLAPKVFETLVVLVERPGNIVEKAELLKLVWPDTFVEENNLTQNISTLRRAFGDLGYIETIPRRGYRFPLASMRLRRLKLSRVPRQSRLPARRFLAAWMWIQPSIGYRRIQVSRADRFDQVSVN